MSLEAFFKPHSIAVIGASTHPEKLGYAVLDNLVHGGYLTDERKVYPINPGAETILDLPVYPSVKDIEEPIDLAVIVIPYIHVPEALRECGEKGIPDVIVISAGFREAGMEGLEREQELVEIAKQYDIRLVGPNCLGVIDTSTPAFRLACHPAGRWISCPNPVPSAQLFSIGLRPEGSGLINLFRLGTKPT